MASFAVACGKTSSKIIENENYENDYYTVFTEMEKTEYSDFYYYTELGSGYSKDLVILINTNDDPVIADIYSAAKKEVVKSIEIAAEDYYHAYFGVLGNNLAYYNYENEDGEWIYEFYNENGELVKTCLESDVHFYDNFCIIEGEVFTCKRNSGLAEDTGVTATGLQLELFNITIAQ